MMGLEFYLMPMPGFLETGQDDGSRVLFDANAWISGDRIISEQSLFAPQKC